MIWKLALVAYLLASAFAYLLDRKAKAAMEEAGKEVNDEMHAN